MKASFLHTLCAVALGLFGLVAAADSTAAADASRSAQRLVPPPLTADETVRELGIAEVSVLRDPGAALTLEKVREPSNQEKFQPLSRALIPNFTSDTIWFRIVLRRNAASSEDWRLELTSTVLNDVQLFSLNPDGGYSVSQAGDQFPFSQREVPNRRPVFAISLPTEEPRTFYLRIQSDSTLAVKLLLWKPQAFEASLQIDAFWIGGLQGVILISLIFFLQAWFLNRDRLLLAAAGVTIAFALAAQAHLGLLSQYLIPNAPGLADAIHPLSLVLFFPVLCLLFGRALELKLLFPRVSKLHILVPILCGTAAVSRVFGLYAEFGWALMMGGMLFGLGWITAGGWLVWYARRRGLGTALAMTLFTASFAGAPLVALNVLPGSRYIEAFWVFGCVGFILLAQFSTLEEVRKARALRRIAERAAQAASQRANQELSWRRQQALYFAGVAHDLRTPLSALRVGLANLGRALLDAPRGVQQRLDRLQLTAGRASDMIERHLQMQRLEQPDIELHLARVDPEECVAQIRAAIVEAWPDRELHVEILPNVPPKLTLDTELVVRAIINLFSNATASAPARSLIELTVLSEPGSGVGFRVTDHGPGLGDMQLADLLEVHWRRRKPERLRAVDQVERFGIGLPMVGRIAALHRGRLEYQRKDERTLFTLWLPQTIEGLEGEGTR